MKKISILLVVCMLLTAVLTACNSAHTHSFGSDWAFDAENHYHACNCGEKSDSAAHADENNDGACDTCGIVMSNDHVFDKAWSSDAENHWHDALCGHDVVDSKAAHTPNSKTGKCSVCGYQVKAPKIESIADALELAAITQAYVKNGIVTTSTYSENYSTNYYSWYEFGENYLHVFDVLANKNVYATREDDGSIFYLTVMDDPLSPVSVNKDADESFMAGPEVNISSITGINEVHYGPVSVLERIYFLEEDTRNDFEESISDGVYSFSYNADIMGEYGTAKYSIDVSFTFSDEYVLDRVTITSSEYNSTTIEFIQSTGIVDAYKPENVFPVSYKIVDSEGKEIAFNNGKAETVEAFVGNMTLKLADIQPSTALIDALGVNVDVLDAEGNHASGVFSTYYGGVINIDFYKSGTYFINIKIGNDLYNIPVNCTYMIPEELILNTYDENLGQYTETSSASVYTDGYLLLLASVAEGCETNQYEAKLIGTNAGDAKLVETVIYGDKGDIKAYDFSSKNPGTYKVEFTSTVDANVKAVMTVTVAKSPNMVDTVKGKYQNNDGKIILNFYPKTENNGKAVVISTVSGSKTEVVFSYVISGKTFNATSENNAYKINIENFKVYVTADNRLYDMNYVGAADPDVWDDPSTGGGSGSDTPNPNVPVSVKHGDNLTNYATTTYKVKLDANGGYATFSFVAASRGDNYSITLTYNGDVNVAVIFTTPQKLESGDSFMFDSDINWNGILSFTNNTGSAIELTFTLTWTEL